MVHLLLSLSQRATTAHFKAKRALEAEHQLEEVGEGIRAMYSWNGEDKYAEK